jgi:D-glycero-alpha-D-manno-heptose-7-phosphate kinase
LFGGGTDYPAHYREQGEVVLSTTIDKFCYISCRALPQFFSNKHRIMWSRIEMASAVSEILHPAVRAGLQFLGFGDDVGLEIQHQGDLPAHAGMGSSSSFAVGLIKALTALRGKTVGRHELALLAIELEQNVMKQYVRSRDQVAAAHDGLNLIHFLRDGAIRVEALIVPTWRMAELQRRLVLVCSGTTRLASAVAGVVIAGLKDKRQILARMRGAVDQAVGRLTDNGDLDDFGRILHENWMLKRELSQAVTSPEVDELYQKALLHGALGGKLLGAGGSGFMVFYVSASSV